LYVYLLYVLAKVIDANALLARISPCWFPELNPSTGLIPGAPTKDMTPSGGMKASEGAGIMKVKTVMIAKVKRLSMEDDSGPLRCSHCLACLEGLGRLFWIVLFFSLFLILFFLSSSRKTIKPNVRRVSNVENPRPPRSPRKVTPWYHDDLGSRTFGFSRLESRRCPRSCTREDDLGSFFFFLRFLLRFFSSTFSSALSPAGARAGVALRVADPDGASLSLVFPLLSGGPLECWVCL